jgi:modulator of FtsH protease HflK
MFKYVLIVICGWLLTGLAQVRPEERAVIKRFGKIVARPGPGLWIGFPWPIDRVERVPIATVRRVNAGLFLEGSSFLTGDQNLIELRIAVDFLVAEGEAALDQQVIEKDRIDDLILRESESLLAHWASGQAVDDALLTGNTRLPFWLSQRLQQQLDTLNLGVQIQQISLAQLAPPDLVRPSFEEVNRAQTQVRTTENRARQDAETRIRSAKGDEFRLQQQALAYRDAKETEAAADVEAFLKRLRSYQRLKLTNPDILKVIWWQEMGVLLTQLKSRGRIDLLDSYLGPNGLDITQSIQTKKR